MSRTAPAAFGVDAHSALAGHAAVADAFVERAREAQRAIARAQAAQAEVWADAHAWARRVAAVRPRASSRTADLEIRDLAAQFGAALRLSDRTVQSQMDAAASLSTLFPATMATWARGEIDRAAVTTIVDAGGRLTDGDARAWFETRALALAAELNPARLRPAVRTLAEHADPESLEQRHARARSGRSVSVTDLDDGMARVRADLPAALAYGIHDRLTSLAQQVRAAEREAISAGAGTERGDSAGDVIDGGATTFAVDAAYDAVTSGGGVRSLDEPRSLDGPRSLNELRADIFADLLLGGAPTAHGDGLDGISAHVQVTVPVLTAVGASREPALLAGYGPIPLSQALHLAGAASGWDRVMTSPIDGAVLTVDRYRPSEQLRRLLRARDEHCRFVGCRQAVWRCDADHTIDHAHGGETHAGNLATLCRRHHVLKHRSEWTVEQQGRGRLRWRSPGGRTYIDRPAPTVRFIPDDELPPF